MTVPQGAQSGVSGIETPHVLPPHGRSCPAHRNLLTDHPVPAGPDPKERPRTLRLRVAMLAVVLLGSLLAPASVTAASWRTVRVPSSIDATGKRDVSSALQAFVNRLPSRRIVQFPKGAVYRLGGNGIRLDGRHDLQFRGRATLRVTGCDSMDSAFVLTGSTSGITIRDLRIVGGNPYGGTTRSHRGSCQHQHGIALYGASDITIRNVRMRNLWGDCLYVGIDRGRWTRDVLFTDSTCGRNGRQGVAIVAGDDIRVRRVMFDKIAMSVLDIEPNDRSGGATDVVFANNRVTSFSHSSLYQSFLFGANGSMDAMVNRVAVRDNVVTKDTLLSLVGDEYFGYSGQRTRRNIRFTGNRSKVTARRAVLNFKHVDGLVISGNVQRRARGVSLTRIVDSTGITRR